VIGAASRSGFTGLVRVGDHGELWFDDGRLYLATGRSSPPLFDVLFGAEVGTRDELEAVCRAADAGGEAVVDQLVGVDPSREPRLRRVLDEHVLAALFELLVPAEEAITLEAGARHVVGARFAQPAEHLVDTARRRIELWRRIAERIPSTGVRFRLAPALPVSERTVTADEWSLLALLDGQRTVAAVVTDSGESAFRVCSVLYRMLLEDLIEEA
jgi:hypothetical protein